MGRVVGATEFKAKCLALLDEVEEHGETLTITRRGKPVTVLSPAKPKTWKSPKGSLAGKVEIVGDIVNYDTSHLWDCLKKPYVSIWI